MSGLYSMFKTDTNLEQNGIWLEYADNSKGAPIRIRIARAGGSNQRYNSTLNAKGKAYKQQIKHEVLSPEVSLRLVRETYAETVVLNWENVEFPVLKDGEPTGEFEAAEFSVANVIRLFTDLPDLFLDVKEQAENMSLFRLSLLEAEAKNSQTS